MHVALILEVAIDENKISTKNELNQCLTEKQNHVKALPTYFHSELIRWRSPCMQQQNDSLSIAMLK